MYTMYTVGKDSQSDALKVIHYNIYLSLSQIG